MPKYWVVLICIGIIIFALWLGQYVKDNELVKSVVVRYGYVGIFIIALVSGFNLAVPIPAISFLPVFLESGLNAWATIFIITVGVTIADMVAFTMGKAGRYAFENNRFVKRIEKLREKNPQLPILGVFLFASLVPLPNEVLGLPMGFMGYNRWAIFVAFLLGNLAFNTLYGLGIVNLFDLLL